MARDDWLMGALAAQDAYRGDWPGQGAATSPRTQTPPNLRNSSFLLYERARGNPMTPERYKGRGLIPLAGVGGMGALAAQDRYQQE